MEIKKSKKALAFSHKIRVLETLKSKISKFILLSSMVNESAMQSTLKQGKKFMGLFQQVFQLEFILHSSINGFRPKYIYTKLCLNFQFYFITVHGRNHMQGVNPNPAFISRLVLCLNFLFLEIIPNLQGCHKNSKLR